MTLRGQVIRRFGIGVLVIAPMLFLLAGSLRFWQGWCFLAFAWGPPFLFALYAVKHDPQLLERRLRMKEKDPRQMLFKALASGIIFSAIALAALDFRLGWTRARLGTVPLWVMLVGQVAVLTAMCLIIWVMKVNSFAARTIEVQAGQKVISTGPYAAVRHPMYSGVALVVLATPLALGSYITLPLFVLIIPVLALRLLGEEKVLRRDLPGYTEYCAHARFRLVPGVW
ncbi:MAG: methyltransferase family protein [Candidatus Sulfotelmatobacter sp.]